MPETSSSVDQGWAWVILAVCTLESLLLVGYVRSFGIYFVEFLTLLDSDASSMTLVIMVQTLVASTTALIVLNVNPALVSSRSFMISGSILLFVAILVNGFATNIGILILSNGILLGIGFGCTHGPATVMVSIYFKKHRGLANGVANLGASVGGFVLPLLIRYLLDSFGLKGSFIILSGIMLNILAFSGLMRPIKIQSVLNQTEETSSDENDSGELQIDDKINAERGLLDNSKHIEYGYKTSITRLKSNFNTCAKESVSYNNPQNVKLFSSYQQLTSTKKYNRNRSVSETLPDACKEEKPFGSIMKSISVNSGLFAYTPIILDTDGLRTRTKIVNNTDVNKTCCFKQLCATIKNLINIELITNRLFILLFVVSILSVVGCAHPVTFIPPHAKDLGISDNDIALILSVIGGSDLLGRIVTIFIADKKFLKCYQIVAISLFFTGIALNLAPILTKFWSLAILGAIYGVFAGVYLTLFPVVLINFVGLEHFSSGMGILALSQGAALTLSIPIVGYLRDRTGSYLGPLHLLGCCSLLAAGILLFEPPVRKIQEKRTLL